MPRKALGFATAFLVLSSAQSFAQTDGRNANVTPAQAITAMRGALRGMVMPQEEFLKKHGAYAKDPSKLAADSAWHATDGVDIRIHDANGSAWSATATHRALPGRSCVLWVGDKGTVEGPKTAKDGKVSTARPGAVACDTE